MFLLSFFWLGVISIPFIILIAATALIAVVYLVYLVFQTIHFRTKLGIKSLENTFFNEETTNIPQYSPAVMGYLVNFQKIGRRELCSTLVDLISRDVVKIILKRGFVSDDNAEYILIRNDEGKDLKEYEQLLVKYLFRNNQEINSNTLNKRLYKNNLNKGFYSKFLKAIQKHAKYYNFFSAKTGKRKYITYKIIDRVVSVIATLSIGLCVIAFEIWDSLDNFDVFMAVFFMSLVTSGILWCLKFMISFMFNLTCYYNDFSEKGNGDYKKWMGFKKYLKTCSTIPDHPLMGVLVWQRYYAYSIGLKMSRKFFMQMKKMKVVDNSIDIGLFETFNDIINNIGVSTVKIKNISIDRYGGGHVDY